MAPKKSLKRLVEQVQGDGETTRTCTKCGELPLSRFSHWAMSISMRICKDCYRVSMFEKRKSEKGRAVTCSLEIRKRYQNDMTAETYSKVVEAWEKTCIVTKRRYNGSMTTDITLITADASAPFSVLNCAPCGRKKARELNYVFPTAKLAEWRLRAKQVHRKPVFSILQAPNKELLCPNSVIREPARPLIAGQPGFPVLGLVMKGRSPQTRPAEEAPSGADRTESIVRPPPPGADSEPVVRPPTAAARFFPPGAAARFLPPGAAAKFMLPRARPAPPAAAVRLPAAVDNTVLDKLLSETEKETEEYVREINMLEGMKKRKQLDRAAREKAEQWERLQKLRQEALGEQAV